MEGDEVVPTAEQGPLVSVARLELLGWLDQVGCGALVLDPRPLDRRFLPVTALPVSLVLFSRHFWVFLTKLLM